MKKSSDYKIGVICVLACQLMWGFLPIFWQALKPIDSWIIILYRIFTMAVYCLIAARYKYSREELTGPLKDKAVRRKYLISGAVLAANWSIYIWAINSERVLQSAIGYYIEPIVICLFGIVLFHEKVTKWNITAMAMAVCAIGLILWHFKQLPGVALGLCFTWATYSAIKKSSDLPPIISMVYETVPYGILSLFIIIFLEARGMGGLAVGEPGKYAMMFLSGLVTVIPIGLFSVSAKKVSLQLIGMAQYISPTITFLLGIYMFKEPLDPVQLIAFVIVWVGLVFFTIGEFRRK